MTICTSRTGGAQWFSFCRMLQFLDGLSFGPLFAAVLPILHTGRFWGRLGQVAWFGLQGFWARLWFHFRYRDALRHGKARHGAVWAFEKYLLRCFRCIWGCLGTDHGYHVFVVVGSRLGLMILFLIRSFSMIIIYLPASPTNFNISHQELIFPSPPEDRAPSHRYLEGHDFRCLDDWLIIITKWALWPFHPGNHLTIILCSYPNLQNSSWF